MSRLGSTGPARQAPPGGPGPAAAASGWIQLQLSGPGESLHLDKRHWAASAVTGPALEQARPAVTPRRRDGRSLPPA